MRAGVLAAGAQPIVNLAHRPRALPSSGWSGSFGDGEGVTRFLPDGGPLGLPVCEIEWTAAAGGGYRRIGCGGASTVPDGGPLTVSVHAMVSTSRTVRFAVDWALISGTYLSTSGVNRTLAAGRWERISLTAAPPPGGVRASLFAVFDTAVAAGTVLAATGAMITEGTLLLPYGDAYMPGWRWLGTKGSSRSVGYPPPV